MLCTSNTSQGCFPSSVPELGQFWVGACENEKLEELWWGFEQTVPLCWLPLCVGRCLTDRWKAWDVKEEADLGLGPQPADQRPSPGWYFPNNASCPFLTLLSFLNVCVSFPAVSNHDAFGGSPESHQHRNIKAILSVMFLHLLHIANTHSHLFAAAEVKARPFSKELVWKWWMEKSRLGDVQELLAQSSFTEQQLLYHLHKYFNFSS